MAIQPPLISNNAEAGPSTAPLSRSPAYQLSLSLSGHRRSVTALRWTSDGRTLLSAGADGLLNFWSTSESSHTISHSHTLRAHRAGINDLSISPDDLYAATASDDNDIHVYTVAAPASSSGTSTALSPTLQTLAGHTAPVLALAFSPKSNLVVSGSFDESAIVWDVQSGAELRRLPAHSEAIWTVGWDGEGMMVLTGSADGLIRLWDATTGQCLKTLDNDSNAPVTSASFTPNPFYLIAGTAGVVRVYNIHTGKVVKTLRNSTSPAPIVKGDAADAKDTAAGPGAVVVVMTAALGSAGDMELDKPQKRDTWILSTTGETGAAGAKVVIWELGTRRAAQILDRHKTTVLALAVHPSGRIIATGSMEPEKIINIWRDDE